MKLISCALSQGQHFQRLNSTRFFLHGPSSKPLGNFSHWHICQRGLVLVPGRSGSVSQCSVSRRGLLDPAPFRSEKAAVDSLLTKSASGLQLLNLTGRREIAHHHVWTSKVNIGTDLQSGIPQRQLRLRGFHTTPQRNVPPVFWFLLKPVAKLGAILSGRSARKWWRALPEDGRQKFRERVRQKWYLILFAAAGLGWAAWEYYRSHIEETPLTGRQRFIAVTHEQFMKIAQAEADGYLETFKEKILPHNHPYYQRLGRVGERLVASNPQMAELLGSKTWKYYIIDDPAVINAFVLPTGQVFVFTGILNFAQNEDQLATIIAHEMAHALLSHGIEQVSYVQLVDFLIISTMAAIWCLMPSDGISIITQWFYNKFINITLHMPYSRMLEQEADKVGLQLAAQACYDVREASVFWARMEFNEGITEDEKIPDWLSTHPSHKKRMDFFDHMVPQAVQIRAEAKCPALSTNDPREMIKEMSSLVDNHRTAKKTGQNLSRVQVQIPSATKVS